MNNKIEENLDRKIKKYIYGKSQVAKLIFPAGLGSIALHETEQILNNLWFPQKFNSKSTLLKNEIIIENIHMFSITELLMRSLCLTDIRLVIFEGKCVGKEAFEKHCKSINWNLYLNDTMSLKLKVDSVASKAFHETGLKEILSSIIKESVKEIVSGENTNETTCVFADLYKDKLTVSISLAGNSLYKRGYRGTLSASAPLREDYASCLLLKSLHFAKKINEKFEIQNLFIPFSGTGTFAFEYLQYKYKFPPALLNREYALQKMPLFKPENFNFLLKKAKEHCLFFKDISSLDSENNLNIICNDNSKNANDALLDNIANFKNLISNPSLEALIPFFDIKNNSLLNRENFLKMDFTKINFFGNLFIPLNPPYGIRIGSNTDSVNLYKNIANKLNELSKTVKKENSNILGFILCPNEETWSVFCRNLFYKESETFHFTQGGIDIRVCLFYL